MPHDKYKVESLPGMEEYSSLDDALKAPALTRHDFSAIVNELKCKRVDHVFWSETSLYFEISGSVIAFNTGVNGCDVVCDAQRHIDDQTHLAEYADEISLEYPNVVSPIIWRRSCINSYVGAHFYSLNKSGCCYFISFNDMSSLIISVIGVRNQENGQFKAILHWEPTGAP